MFDRFRIGGALFNACDAAARQGSSIDRTVIKTFAYPLLDAALIDMRAHHLRADQAAAVLFIGLIESMHRDGLLKRAMLEDYHAYQSLYQMYCFYFSAVIDQPEYFAHARLLLNDRTFSQIQAY